MIVINFIYTLVGTPMGYIMWPLYLLVNNFGIAVILFTLIVKLASFPLNLKQQKNMAKSQLFMPRVQEIQNKYKNNQTKMQEEMAKLQKEGYNPTGGCGSMLLIMVILFGVIDVVYKPMTHLERFEWEQKGSIEIVKQVAMETDYTSIILASPEDAALVLEYAKDPAVITISDANPQLVKSAEWTYTASKNVSAADREKYGKIIMANASALADKKTSRLSDPIKAELQAVQTRYSSIYGEINAVQTFAVSPDAFKDTRISSAIYDKLVVLHDNMMFFGLDLGQTPSLAFEPLIIIPIFSFVFSMLQMLITQKQQSRTMGDAATSNASMKVMLWITPIFSLFISFTVPAGAGLYWGVSYVFGIAQTLITQKFWPIDKLKEDARIEMEQNSAKYKTTATIVDVTEDGKEVVKTERLTNLSAKEQKEYYRKKLEAARKEDLEKYGDISEEDAYSDNIDGN